jgi:hypothetical protein
MRMLYYVPIIHSGADMASLEAVLEGLAVAELGKEFWQRHREVVSGFWNSIAGYFDLLDVHSFRIYQDALVADGDAGMKIVSEGVKGGSRNYEIISLLLDKGAILTRTEDVYWVKREYDMVVAIASAKLPIERQIAMLRYRLAGNTLLTERDRIIAGRIDETLGDGESGILFLGAYHDILPELPADIAINPVKEVNKIREFNRTMLSARDRKRWNELADYLVSPVKITKYSSNM